MSSHGAIDTETRAYVLPFGAARGRQYECADCKQRVIFRSGEVRVPHFAHFTPTTKCRYYEGSPGESENHKHAKRLLQKWLTEKKPMQFGWGCGNQTQFGTCGTADHYTEHSIDYKDGDQVVLEYRDPKGKYIADVAVLNEGKLRYIIEVVHSHRTTTQCRPEPWFEVNANDVDEGCHYGEPTIFLESRRVNDKRYCSNCTVKQQAWTTSIPVLPKKYGKERGWEQDKPCICCGTDVYSPEWIASRPRQVCKICIGTQHEKVHEFVNALIWS